MYRRSTTDFAISCELESPFCWHRPTCAVHSSHVLFVKNAPSPTATSPVRPYRAATAESPALRLVKPDATDLYDPLGAQRPPLEPGDARLVFAQAVAACIEGGTAALLRVEKRNALHKHARKLGLRVFDANLIIAIVQDAARRGEVLPSSASFTRDAQKRIDATLALMPGPQAWSDDAKALAIIAVVLSVFLLVAFILFIGP